MTVGHHRRAMGSGTIIAKTGRYKMLPDHRRSG